MTRVLTFHLYPSSPTFHLIVTVPPRRNTGTYTPLCIPLANLPSDPLPFTFHLYPSSPRPLTFHLYPPLLSYLSPMPRFFLSLSALLLSLLLLAGCYSFSATNLPPHIKTIRIADVQNLTTDPMLGVSLREGLVTMLRKNASSIRIVSDSADAEFQISILNYTNTPDNVTRDALVETYKVVLTVDVLFQDLVKDSVIYQAKNQRAEGVYNIAKNETEDKHGQQRAIEKLQELIVNGALAKW